MNQLLELGLALALGAGGVALVAWWARVRRRRDPPAPSGPDPGGEDWDEGRRG